MHAHAPTDEGLNEPPEPIVHEHGHFHDHPGWQQYHHHGHPHDYRNPDATGLVPDHARRYHAHTHPKGRRTAPELKPGDCAVALPGPA